MKTRIALGTLLLAALPLVGQTFISAKAGLVNYEEGVQATSPRQLQEGERFTASNRSEVLLTPGSFLRLNHDSEIFMVSTRLTHPAVEISKGLASFEVDEMGKDSNITIQWNEYKGERAFVIDRKGLYRFETSEDGTSLKVMVMMGHLAVPGGPTLKDGQETIVGASGAQSLTKFDKKQRDDFDQWGAYRASLLSNATVKTAQSMTSGNYPGMSSWVYNSFLGMFAYLPYNSMVWSPYGYMFYSPGYIGRYYGNYGGYYGNGYYGNGSNTGGSRTPVLSGNNSIQRPAPRVPIPVGPSTTNPSSNVSYAGSLRGNDSNNQFPTSMMNNSPSMPSGNTSFSSSVGSSGAAPSIGSGGHASAPVGRR